MNVQLIQALHLPFEDLLSGLVPFLRLGLLTEFLLLGAAFLVAQLLVDVLQLLAQEILALLIVDGMLGAVLYVKAQVGILYFAVEELQEVKGTHLHVVILKEPHLLREFEGHVV